MSTPEPVSRRGALRFLGATLAVTAVYIALDVIWFTAAGPFVQRYHAARESAQAPDLDTAAREMAEAARRSGATATAAQRVAAWRLGHQLGLASQLDQAAVIMRSDWAARAAEQVLGQASPSATALGLEAVVPLRARTMAQASNLALRIEADELGLAAQMERMGGGPLRHLFLAGMFSGKAAYTRLYTPLDDPADAPHIERHARLAGLPTALWQPVARPPGATAELRREAFTRAVQQLDAALQGEGIR